MQLCAAHEKQIISVTSQLIKQISPPRLVSSRKGDNGIALIIGGSGIYHGAPLLSTLSALRSGVDLVYTAVPKSNVAVLRSFSPDIIVLPFPRDDFDVRSAKYTLRILPKKPDVVAIGMGMKLATPESLKYTLNALKVYSTAKKYGITIILKGYYNIICDGGDTQGGQKHIAIIKRTTPAMTVGGCGDILSGVVAGLFSKMPDAFSASIMGVYFTGIAGELAYQKVGLHMVATDLIEQLPSAMKPFDKIIYSPKSWLV